METLINEKQLSEKLQLSLACLRRWRLAMHKMEGNRIVMLDIQKNGSIVERIKVTEAACCVGCKHSHLLEVGSSMRQEALVTA
jgi:hypothetical protein